MDGAKFDVDSLKIAKPCSAKWAKMDGDERARSCGLCQKQVYNVAGMTRLEVHDLIRSNEKMPCLRLRRRHDGTIVTRDCPIGVAGARRRLLFTVTTSCFLVWTALAATKVVSPAPPPPTSEEMVETLRTKPVVGPIVDKICPVPPVSTYHLMGAAVQSFGWP